MYECMYDYGMVASAVQGGRVFLSRLLLLSPPAPHTFDPSIFLMLYLLRETYRSHLQQKGPEGTYLHQYLNIPY